MAGWSAVVGAALVLGACGGPGGDDAGEVAAIDGAAVFGASCAACHGPEAEGTANGPPLVHVIYEPGHHDDASFRRAIADGVVPHHWDFGPMPPIGLPDAEAEAVIAHIRGLQRAAGIID